MENQNQEISVAELLQLALKYMWILIGAAILGAVLAFSITKFMIVPQYQAKSNYLIDTAILNMTSKDDVSVEAVYNAQRASSTVRNSYIEILNTRMFAKALKGFLADKPLSKEYTDEQLFKMLNFTFEEEHESFKITVTAATAEDAKCIASTIEEHAEDYIAEKKNGADETLKVIDAAILEPNPVNNNSLMFAVFGAFGAFVLAYVVIYIVDKNDVRVKDEKSLTAQINMPVIGTIPEIISLNKTESAAKVRQRKTLSGLER